MNKIFSKIFSVIILYTTILICWVVNYIKLRKKFFVSELRLLNPVVYKNNIALVRWECEGVFKIEVKGVGTFTGFRNSLPFLIKEKTNLLFTFHGINTKITREISIEPVDLNFEAIQQINSAKLDEKISLEKTLKIDNQIKEFYPLRYSLKPKRINEYQPVNLNLKTNINLIINKSELYEKRFLHNT